MKRMKNSLDRYVPKRRNKGETSSSTGHTDHDDVMSDSMQTNPAFDNWRYFKQDWPKCNNLEDSIRVFFHTTIEPDVQRWVGIFQAHSHTADDWRSMVFEETSNYLSLLESKLAQIPHANSQHRQLLKWLPGAEQEFQLFAYTRLAWIEPPWRLGRAKDLSSQHWELNNLCSFFILYKKDNGEMEEEEESEEETTEELETSKKEKAFHSQPCKRDFATPVYQEIVKYYGDFNSSVHIAPYTSLVGPSGIGKSHVVSQIPQRGLAYVVYFSWASRRATSYPGRSRIIDTLNRGRNRDELQRALEMFFAINLVLVGHCRELGLTPAALFDLQVKEDFKDFQEEICSLLFEFQGGIDPGTTTGNLLSTGNSTKKRERIRSEDDPDNFDYQEYVQKHLEKIKGRLRSIIVEQHRHLQGDTNCAESYFASPKDLKVKKNHPKAIICVDEARGLFDPAIGSTSKNDGLEWRFQAFRRALRHQSKNGPDTDSKQLFGLLLDTSSRVADFSPPIRNDPSAREAKPFKLYPPIWRINTKDLFADGAMPTSIVRARKGRGLKKPAVTVDYAKLFTLGRPLWGALLRTENTGVEYITRLAERKILGAKRNWSPEEGHQVERLALLSFRLNFHVSEQPLAEQLVSGYLRYIVEVNDQRTLLRTKQPSEPLLAHVASRLMHLGGEQGRLELIKSFYKKATEGFINVGDIGEAVAALVLLFTWDRASDKIESQARFRPIPVADFFGTFLSSKVVSQVEKRAREDKDLTKVWRGYFFFNHMIRARDKISEEDLHGAFHRGAGILLRTGQAGADILIPIFISNSEMSWFLIQVKNRKDDTMTDGRRGEAKRCLKAALDNLPNGRRAHLGMMMCLRSPQPEAIDVVYPDSLHSHYNPPKYKWNDLKRVVVLSCGLDTGLFPGLGFIDKPAQEPGIVDSIELLKEMLNYTAENIKEEATDYYQKLCSFR